MCGCWDPMHILCWNTMHTKIYDSQCTQAGDQEVSFKTSHAGTQGTQF